MSKRQAHPQSNAKAPATAAAESSSLAAGMEYRATRLPPYVVVLFLFTVSCMIYWPAMRGGLLWDDAAHVTRPDRQSFAGLYRIWFNLGATQQYYPLLHTAFWLEHRLWGDVTLGYHLTNVLLHATVASLVYAVLRKLRIQGAFLAAAIFAVHPVHVESVAWISEQKNTLSAVFYLTAMWAYLSFDQSQEKWLYILAFGLFALGLLTKTVIATLPAALLVIFWWQRGKLSWRTDIWPLVPFFLLGAVAGAFTAWVERKYIGAEGNDFDMTLVERGLLAGRGPWFYFWKLLWPTDLVFIYPRWKIDPAVWWQWLFPAATIVLLAAFWAVRHRWRGPLAGYLLFVGTLFPALGFLNVYPFIFSFVADHFQYLASLGILVLIAAGATQAVNHMPSSWQTIARGFSVLALATLAVLTWRDAHAYSDVATLYKTTLARNPTCWLACNNLGLEYASAGRHQDAVRLYEQAIRLRPDYAQAHCDLGVSLGVMGRPQEAIAQFRLALELWPGFGDAYNNLGRTLVLTGKPREAIEYHQRAVQLLTGNAEAKTNLAIALAAAGETAQAIEQLEQVLKRQPQSVDAHFQLAQVLLDDHQPDRAAAHAAAALRIEPTHVEAGNVLGAALGQMGRYDEAAAQFERIVRIKPKFAQARSNLVFAYAALGRSQAAIAAGVAALEQARANGETALAERTEHWLANYQSQHSSSRAGSTPQPSQESEP